MGWFEKTKPSTTTKHIGAMSRPLRLRDASLTLSAAPHRHLPTINPLSAQIGQMPTMSNQAASAPETERTDVKYMQKQHESTPAVPI